MSESKSVAEWLASVLPARLSARCYLTLQVRLRDRCGSAGLATAYLILVWEAPEGDFLIPLLRLPGARLVELWSAQGDPWLTGGAS